MVMVRSYRIHILILVLSLAGGKISAEELLRNKPTASWSSDNGKVLSSHDDLIKHATAHKIEIYPPKEADSDEKITRDGLLVCYKGAKANILICHGFMSNHCDAGVMRRIFPRGQYNCMTFDFRAHGDKKKCEGQYCTFGRDEALDVLTAARFLQEHPDTKDKPIIGFGFSMGASSLIMAQAKDPLFKALVLDCPFDSSKGIITRTLGGVKFSILGYEFNMPGKGLLADYAFHPYIQTLVKKLLKTVAQLNARDIKTYICHVSPEDSIKKVDVPCFFIHCKNDKKVSTDAIKTVFNGAAGYKKLWLTPGRWHFDSYFYNPEGYTERVRDFIKNALADNLPQHEDKKIVEDEVDVLGHGDPKKEEVKS